MSSLPSASPKKPFVPAAAVRPAPAVAVFEWGCLFGRGDRFTYLYGPAQACEGIVRALALGQYQRKGKCSTLDEARALSEAAAVALEEFYGDIGGGSQALWTDDYPTQLSDLGLEFRCEMLLSPARAGRLPRGP